MLDNDPTVFCVNAFNSNSLPGTAADASQLLRSESFPMYGWMVRRSYARQVVVNWIPNGVSTSLGILMWHIFTLYETEYADFFCQS